MSARAIRLSVRDPDLRRNRLTVGFRLLLAIPHLLWVALWFFLAATVASAQWIVILFSGEPSPMLHRFTAAYVRYAAQVTAYVTFAADPYPRFTGDASYPVDVEIDPPQRQNRWVTGFRIFLAVPAILLADTLMGGGVSFSGGSVATTGGVVATVAFLGWFACLARGAMPEGFRDVVAYAIGYSAQVTGYLLLVTDRYPTSDPTEYEAANVYRSDPIWLTVDDDLRRSRLTVFFRLLLAIPHFVWLLLWGIAAFFALIGNWFATLFRGSSPPGLHRFLASYLRYQVHVLAYVQLVANPFPGFTGRPGTYPIEVEIEEPALQRRPVTGFRAFLAIPAFLVSSALGGAAYVAAFLTWFYALARGRAPQGLRNLGAFELRYYAQVTGYIYLLTERYPYSGPSAGWQLPLVPEPAPAPEPGLELIRRLTWIVVAALLVAAWLVAAHLLWPTQVPDGLHLADLDPSRYFSAPELDEARDFERFLNVVELLSLVVLVAVLGVYAVRGERFTRESAAGRIGTGMLLGMLGFALVWLAQLPFGLVSLWWERRHDVARVGYLEWAFNSFVGLGSVFLFICLAILIVMGFAGRMGDRWWIAGAPVFVALGLLSVFVSPYLIPDLHPLHDERLQAEAKRLARAEGVDEIPVRVQEVKKFTTEPNAAAVGLGPTRRIVVWDTLLEKPFTRREVRVVLAHELGHHSRNHLWKLIGWYALFAVPGAFLIARATRRRGGMYEPAAVPLALLVLVVLQLAATPAQNVVTRRYEAEADWVALRAARDPQAARAAFTQLAKTSLSDPDPPAWEQALQGTHPTIMQRIAMVDAWEDRRRTGR